MRYPRGVCAGLLVLSLFMGVACAHSAGSSRPGTDAAADSVTPARIVNRATMTRIPVRFKGTVELPIDATGRPDIGGMRVMGRITDEVRRELSAYLEQFTYAPATRNGVPVSGVFKMTFRR